MERGINEMLKFFSVLEVSEDKAKWLGIEYTEAILEEIIMIGWKLIIQNKMNLKSTYTLKLIQVKSNEVRRDDWLTDQTMRDSKFVCQLILD